MKIGIFGGTFDPFHVGHLAIAKAALSKVDKLFIVPTICDYYRPDKRHLFNFDEKVRIITEMTLAMKNVEIDLVERDKDSKWRTINTVEYFAKKFPDAELYLIIGEDSLKNFPTWFRYDDILNMCTLLVANRGIPVQSDIAHEVIDIGNDFEESSSSKVRQKLIEELIDMYLSDKDWYNFERGKN